MSDSDYVTDTSNTRGTRTRIMLDVQTYIRNWYLSML
jgi:hypothetical protein